MGWTAPDLHGSVAAVLAGSGASISDAFRYDGYGETIASLTSSLPSPWRYQGRLLLNSASQTDLYDFVARAYDPALGAFTGLDTTAGSAQDPITLNRYLYAGADPATLIDPDGHDGWDPFGFVSQTAQNVGAFAQGVGEGVADAAVGTVTGTVSLARSTVAAGGCALNNSCRNSAVASLEHAARDFAGDPVGHVQAAAAVAGTIAGAAVDHVATAVRTGNFRELGKITGAIAVSFVPIGGVLAKGAQLARAAGDIGALGRIGEGIGAATAAGRVAVADGIGEIGRVTVVRVIDHGERVRDLAHEALERQYATNAEHAVVSLIGGGRRLISGGSGGISLEGLPVRRVLFHTHHPLLADLAPSIEDRRMLLQLKQTKSWIAGRGGNLQIFRGN